MNAFTNSWRAKTLSHVLMLLLFLVVVVVDVLLEDTVVDVVVKCGLFFQLFDYAQILLEASNKEVLYC